LKDYSKDFLFYPPLALASGTWGLGENLFKYYSEAELRETFGVLVSKGICLLPRKGNPPPRIWETPGGLINFVGLANPGVKEFKKAFLPRLLKTGVKIFVNLYGEEIEEFIALAEEFKETGVCGLELNISCPNVKKGGIAFASQPQVVKELVKEVRKVWESALWVKLSPVGPVLEVAKACESSGADALVVANTYPGLVVIEEAKLLRGGVSGPAIKPLTLRLVYEVSREVSTPVIGCGGIASARDVWGYFVCGVKAVQLGTAFLVDPDLPKKLSRSLEKNGVCGKRTCQRGALQAVCS